MRVSAFLSMFFVSAACGQSITSLTRAQIDTFTSFTHYASTAYCQPSTTLSWNCGANCEANKNFIPTASGGDGFSKKFWYVGYDPSLNTVVLAIQGGTSLEAEAIVTDANAFQESLDSTLFPGIASSVEVMNTFHDDFAKIATDCLDAIQTALNLNNASKATIVGHSLGGALASLAAVYLQLHISGVNFSLITYGQPRVGNQAFANYVDAFIHATRINNKKDPIPIQPGRLLGYYHFSGEVHIQETEMWATCPGQDNPSTECSTGDVSNIFEGVVADNDGPYNGINIGC